jgi:hypothetical protein
MRLIDQFAYYTSWQDGLLVQNNTATGTNDTTFYAANSAKNYVVRCNTLHDTGAMAIHNNGDLSQGSPGINYNALIENNTIYNTASTAISCDGVQNSRIQNNLMFNIHSRVISLFQVDAADGSKNNFVVNNTAMAASDGQGALRMVDNSTGNTVLNNVLFTANPTQAAIDLNSGDLTGLHSDYNVVVNLFRVDGSPSSLAAWQANGQDAHSFIAAPAALFVNPTGNDYHLLVTSPARDTGTSEQAPSADIEGTPRPMGPAFDIGAYEYHP